MNKKIYWITTIILICLFLVTGTYTFIHYYYNYSADEWFRENFEDGNYVIVGDEIGNTIFEGDTHVKIAIFDYINNTRMVSFKTRLNNKGEKLSDNNYRIEFTEEYIKIQLIDADKVSTTYRFYFEDFNQ